jgi:hypothetical protein
MTPVETAFAEELVAYWLSFDFCTQRQPQYYLQARTLPDMVSILDQQQVAYCAAAGPSE